MLKVAKANSQTWSNKSGNRDIVLSCITHKAVSESLCSHQTLPNAPHAVYDAKFECFTFGRLLLTLEVVCWCQNASALGVSAHQATCECGKKPTLGGDYRPSTVQSLQVTADSLGVEPYTHAGHLSGKQVEAPLSAISLPTLTSA